MDIILRKLLALVVPWLFFIGVKMFSKASGGAAVADALEDIGGPLGMQGGLGTLIIVALITDMIVGRLYYSKLKARIKTMRNEGKSREEIIDHISTRGLYSRGLRYRILMGIAMPESKN